MVPTVRAATSVLLADDDAALRLALRSLLDGEDDFDVVGEAADGHQALDFAQQYAPAMAIVDVRMPFGGPDLVRALRGLPQQPVVVGLSANTDGRTRTRMLAAGASTCLLKGAVGDDLPSLLRRCLRDEPVVDVPGTSEVVRRRLP